jgi:uncharacterized membrane protein (DUF4010 family)
MSPIQQHLYFLSVALAIGLLIGLERGWQERKAEEGRRVAGLRTYGLLGLLGGVVALLSEQFGPLVLGLAFVAVIGGLTAIYIVNLPAEKDVGITSLVAALLTFGFGALAASGEVAIAAASAVVTTLLLSYKPQLHRWVSGLEMTELRAGIKLLIISVVCLPILPDRGFGPWQALNPFEIWWMVVLIAAISFVGYFAVKIGGPRRGIIFTGLFGGLASSTAVTLHLSRTERGGSGMTTLLATGILLACGTMFPRMLLVASLINPALFRMLVIPGLVMSLLAYGPAMLYWRSALSKDPNIGSPLQNPLELKAALGFGALLTVILLLGKALQAWFGDAGLLALAAVSGVTDVDAITLSLARMSDGDVTMRICVTGIVIAGAVNSLAKTGLAAIIGGRRIGALAGLPLMLAALGGLVATWLWVW